MSFYYVWCVYECEHGHQFTTLSKCTEETVKDTIDELLENNGTIVAMICLPSTTSETFKDLLV